MSKKNKLVIGLIYLLIILFFGTCLIINNFVWKDELNSYTIFDSLPDGRGRKATIILIGGQSNASGCTYNEYLKNNVSHSKYEEYSNGYNNVYINYVSGNNASYSFVKCAIGQGETKEMFGIELGLAEKLNVYYPDDLFFIIKFAKGATELYSHWISPLSTANPGPMYNNFIKFVKTNIKYLKNKNYEVKIEGMCWMQGESDSFFIDTATNYKFHLMNLIHDIRLTFDKYSSIDGIAFIDAHIQANPLYWVYYDLINESKNYVSKLSKMNVIIDTNLKGLTCSNEPKEKPDIPHYDSLSEIKLGHLFADEIIKFFD